MPEKAKYSALVCYRVTELYRNLLNSYVSDFYLEEHWTRNLPPSWRLYLKNLPLNQLEQLLNYHQPYTQVPLAPLSLLCVLRILTTHSVPRNTTVPNTPIPTPKKCSKYLWKNVKLKKRHEIEVMAKMCHKIASKTGCFNIVDVGSGLGHLSRFLAYQYGFRVCTFEANDILTKTASELDRKFEETLLKKNISHSNTHPPVHVNMRIHNNLQSEEFVTLVQQAFNETDNFKFGIVGLHPCGDLGATLLRLFNQSTTAIFINMVSCCYMKLTLKPAIGYPLSEHSKMYEFNLDYLACEAACHAIESYRDNLSEGDYSHLKIHSYRAALECLLSKLDMRHCSVNNVKYRDGLGFYDYSQQATQKYNLSFLREDVTALDAIVEATWTDVVKFYSVRLLLAPLVESAILYDRFLFVIESGAHCDIVSAFDSKISARSHVLYARKCD